MTYPVAGVVVSPDTAANWGAPRLWLRPPLFLLAFGILLPRIPSLGAWRHGGHHADALSYGWSRAIVGEVAFLAF